MYSQQYGLREIQSSHFLYLNSTAKVGEIQHLFQCISRYIPSNRPRGSHVSAHTRVHIGSYSAHSIECVYALSFEFLQD